jgi:uncharacterized protein YwbE
MYIQVPRRIAATSMLALLLAGYITTGNVSALARSYLTTDSSIMVGMVVATESATDTSSTSDVAVRKANQKNAALTVGVVTDISANELSYANAQKGELLVTNTGQVQAYVSDVNGVPKPDDLLVPSPLDGILMKADSGTNGIVGSTIGSFPSSTADVYKLEGGTTARIAVIGVNLDIHPVNKPNTANGVQDFVSTFVGRQVGLVQLFVSGAILSLTLIVGGGMMYAAIANYLTGISRNPLARKMVFRGLLHVMSFVLIIFAVGITSGLGILWL